MSLSLTTVKSLGSTTATSMLKMVAEEASASMDFSTVRATKPRTSVPVLREATSPL
jgi:hypothetical protein